MLDATMGYDVGDRYIAPPPLRPYIQEVGLSRSAAYRFHALHATRRRLCDDCLKGLMDVVRLCTELGHDLVEANPVFDTQQLARAFNVI